MIDRGRRNASAGRDPTITLHPGVLLAALLVCLSLSRATAAATTLLTETAGRAGNQAGRTTTIKTFDDWRVTCSRDGAGRSCHMETGAEAVTEDGTSIDLVLTGEPTGDGDPLFSFTTPLDLLVANGIEMRVDSGQTMRLAYRSCHAGGCIVPFSLSSEIEPLMRRGHVLNARLFELKATPIDVEISLMGFTAALGELRRR